MVGIVICIYGEVLRRQKYLTLARLSHLLVLESTLSKQTSWHSQKKI